LIPGLYYVFGKIAERFTYIKNQKENPLTEEFDNHHAE